MELGLLPLALLMAAATYPWRAIPLLSSRIHRLPPVAHDYLRLVGPAMLATLAAVAVAVSVDAARNRSFHFGIEWLAVAICVAIVALNRSLLIGLLAAVALVAVFRLLGVEFL